MSASPKPNHQWTCLCIDGNDSRTFLQGQLSNDLDLINDKQGGFFALCTPKGRTLANFFIVQAPGSDPNHLLLLVPSSTAQIVLDTLAKYIVFSKADLRQTESSKVSFVQLGESFPYATLGVSAPDTQALAASTGPDVGLLQLGGAIDSKFGILIHSSTRPPHESIQPFFLSPNDIELALIRAGIGLVQGALSDEFVPQMLNMQLNNGISFTKGCYTGQEIVARAQYRGKIKRRMYRAHCVTESLPNVGAEITDADSNKALGVVLSAARSSSENTEILAVLSLKENVEQSLMVADQTLTLADLPYDKSTET